MCEQMMKTCALIVLVVMDFVKKIKKKDFEFEISPRYVCQVFYFQIVVTFSTLLQSLRLRAFLAFLVTFGHFGTF